MILHPLPWLVHVLEVNSTQEPRAGSWMGGITHSTSNYLFGFPNPHKVYKFLFSKFTHGWTTKDVMDGWRATCEFNLRPQALRILGASHPIPPISNNKNDPAGH